MNQLNGYDLEDLRVGMSASFSKTITEADLVLFVGVSGDNNAMHVNEEFAAATPFGGRLAHDMLLASAHAFLTLRQLTWGTELFGPLLLTEQIVREAPVYRDFTLQVPRTPGLGLSLDKERPAFFART